MSINSSTAFRRVRDTIRWRIQKAAEQSALSNRAVARVELKIADAEEAFRSGEEYQAFSLLTHAAIYLGRQLYTD